MQLSSKLTMAAVLAVALGGSALAQNASGGDGAVITYPKACSSQATASVSGMNSGAQTDTSQMKEYQRAAIEGMKRMHGDMMKGVTKNDPDVAFICEMIAHHQGAIDMSKIELKHGNNGKAKAMARQVIKAQTREIKEMKSWLKKNL